MNTGFIGMLTAGALLATGVALATPAAAGTVSGTYNGLVTSADAPVNSQFAVNDAFSFSFSYDDTIADGAPGDTTLGQYGDLSTTGSGSAGSYNFSVTGNAANLIAVVDQPGNDKFGISIVGLSGALVSGYTLVGLSIDFSTSNDVFPSDALPTAYVPASLFQSRNFVLTFIDDPNFLNPTQNYARVIGSITATPIPAALPLFASALAGLGLLGWRRRRAP